MTAELTMKISCGYLKRPEVIKTTRFKDFTNDELKALHIKMDDFQTTVTMDIGTYCKSLNKISGELAAEMKKRSEK